VQRISLRSLRYSFLLICLFGFIHIAVAQSTGTIQGSARDTTGAVIPHAKVTIRNVDTGVVRTSETDGTGIYAVPSLQPGTYSVTVSAPGMQDVRQDKVQVTVGGNLALNFEMKVGVTDTTVDVNAAMQPALDTTSPTQSQTLDQQTVQDIPLNGRHFIDLFPTIAGTVTPPQSGSLSAPTRGTGASGFNSAGYREDMTNLMINGISHTDLQQNQIAFQPTINVVSEFKVMNSTPSAEFGRSAGTIVNVSTRAGTNAFHGEAYEYIRNNVFDARNFFNPVTVAASPFKRNQFGGDFGGPIWKDHTFFFVTYEGLRQRQGVTINSTVLTNAQRMMVTDPVVLKLLPLIPTANNATGTSFQGSASAPVNINQWSVNINHTFNSKDSLNGFYIFQTDKRQEPTLQGDTVPGFGDARYFRRQFISLNETHIFNAKYVNEARFGISRLRPNYLPLFAASPAAYGINDGITVPVGLPLITISSIGLVIGGPSAYPQYRGDTTGVLSDTLSILEGKHYIRTGGEYRRFISSNTIGNTGSFTFATPTTFANDQANAFSVNEGFPASRIFTNAVNAFVQDSYKMSSNLTLEAGVRFEWNGTPTEGDNRFVTFNPANDTLQQVGSPGYSQLYSQQYFVEPRIGFVWDPTGAAKFVIRGGYAIQAEQPITNPLVSLSQNPPFAVPLSFTSVGGSTVSFSNAATVAAASALKPSTTPTSFEDAYVQNYNMNLQYALAHSLSLQVGYAGNKGTHLRLTRNINQPINGVKPFAAISASSPFAPGRALGTAITDYDSDGISNYNALWVILTKQVSHGLQLNSSYTYSKSMDYNSLSTQGVILQDSYNPSNNYGPSDYDVRNRFVFSGVYSLPLRGNELISGWELSGILQLQGGNPFSVFTNSPANGTAGTIRATQAGHVGLQRTFLATGAVQYINPSICYTAATGCTFSNPTSNIGAQGRNEIFGPGYENTDISIAKFFKVFREARLELRANAFNLLNHPNLGQPVTQFTVGTGLTAGTVTAGTFGQITSTRFPLGDSGSSRQLQLSMKLTF
jgi:hypothetical protein